MGAMNTAKPANAMARPSLDSSKRAKSLASIFHEDLLERAVSIKQEPPAKTTIAEPGPLPPLLRIPLEIRLEIYSYLVPTTKRINRGRRNEEIVWRRGQISLMVTNRQIHDEVANLIYGSNTFVIDVAYDAIIFRFRRLLSSGLVPKETPSFLSLISKENVELIRNVIINVDHVDSYTGMVKYGYQGKGLTEGLKKQVQKLVDVLQTCRELSRIQVNLRDWNRNVKSAQTVLEPFRGLRNVKDAVIVSGAVTPEFAEKLRQETRAWEERHGISDVKQESCSETSKALGSTKVAQCADSLKDLHVTAGIDRDFQLAR